jgi:hypothetical protein
VSFHVEVRKSFHHARLFNLSEEQLRRRVLEPWTRGASVEMGDREWSPADSSLTVLEGRTLDTAELALGQGWSNASRVSEDVTARLLAEAGSASGATGQAPVAVLADTPAAASAMGSLLEDLGLVAVEWELVQARILAGAAGAPSGSGSGADGGGSGVAAVVVVLEGQMTPQLALAVGLALGALRGGTVLVQLGTAPLPAELAHLSHIRPDAEGQAWVHALAERLQLAGCAVRARPGWDTPGRFAHL